MRTVAFLLALIGATACAAYEPGEAASERDPRIGDEVRQICFARTISGWRALKGVDNAVLLSVGANDWYYAELHGSCPSYLLRSAETIGLETIPAGGCVGRSDVILVEDVGGGVRRCFIDRMYRWNEDAVEAEEADNGN